MIVFYENYRANKYLFDASFAVLERMFPRLIGDFYQEKPFAASKTPGEPIVVHKAPTEWKEGAYIFDTIQTLPKDAKIGILVRQNSQAQYLSALFERFNEHVAPEEQRQFMIIDEYKFFRRQEIKDVMAYFKLLLNPHDAVSAKRIIMRYVKGIGEARIQQIESEDVRTMGLRLTDFMDMQIFEKEPYDGLLQGLTAGKMWKVRGRTQPVMKLFKLRRASSIRMVRKVRFLNDLFVRRNQSVIQPPYTGLPMKNWLKSAKMRLQYWLTLRSFPKEPSLSVIM